MTRKDIKIVAIDLDGTLCEGEVFVPEQVMSAVPIKKRIETVNALHKKNFIIIYTARRDELIPETLKWLKKHNVRFHAFSNNKMPADVYYDDHAINATEL